MTNKKAPETINYGKTFNSRVRLPGCLFEEDNERRGIHAFIWVYARSKSAYLVPELHTVEFFRGLQQFRSKSGCDKLRLGFQIPDHICHCFPILGVQCSINFIKQIERSWIAFLNSKNQGECHQRFLSAGELIHVTHVRGVPGKTDANANTGESFDVGNRASPGSILITATLAFLLQGKKQKTRLEMITCKCTAYIYIYIYRSYWNLCNTLLIDTFRLYSLHHTGRDDYI